MSECDYHRRLGPRPPTEQEMLESAKKFTKMMLELMEKKEMGDFNINITACGGHGCERNAKEGDKLYSRCGKISCPDCITYDFVQRLKQVGMFSNTMNAKAEFTHWPGTKDEVIDDMLKNERIKGHF